MLSSEYRQASPVWTCGSQCSLRELSSPFTLLPFVKYAIMFLMGNSWGLRTNDGDAERACCLQCGSPVEGQHCAKVRALTFVMFPTF